MTQIPSQPAITEVLQALSAKEPGAMDQLMSIVYADLTAIAHKQLRLEAYGHSLSTTDLVHEAYLKLAQQTHAQWIDRNQFFAIAAQVMRRLLVSYARKHYAVKRGGRNQQPVSLSNLASSHVPDELAVERSEMLLDMDDALNRLAALDRRQAQVVECRFFGGFSEAETAQALGVTERTVARDWVKARGWLYRELHSAHA